MHIPVPGRLLVAAVVALGVGLASATELTTYGPAVEVFRFADPAIRESSGLVLSRRQAGVMWTHNDSGDKPRAFAVDRRGRTLGTYALSDAVAWDWEDIAIGPGPDPARDYLYLGDIGDNGLIRPGVQVYRIPEPTVDTMKTGVEAVIARVERFTLQYPDEPHNCEALLVHPKTGAIYLVTKEAGATCVVYRCSTPRPGQTQTLERVAELRAPDGHGNVTAGDISPDGLRIVLRNYNIAWEYRAQPGRAFDDTWRGQPVTIPMPAAGEAIAYSADSTALLTTTEGEHAPVHELRRNAGR